MNPKVMAAKEMCIYIVIMAVEYLLERCLIITWFSDRGSHPTEWYG